MTQNEILCGSVVADVSYSNGALVIAWLLARLSWGHVGQDGGRQQIRGGC